MMKIKNLLLLFVTVLSTAICGCTSNNKEPVDYVAQTKLDLNDTSKVYAEVTVLRYVDGDTTHFALKDGFTPKEWIEDEYLKARYNSVDTPESTGKVEKWGKTAAYYTRDALSSATSIIIQSDTNKWNKDSTGERYLVWVWYKTASDTDYHLLNLELIQNGLAKLKSASDFSLYDTFLNANNQAIALKYNLYDANKVDENWYAGKAINMTIEELRLNAEEYAAQNAKVSVEGLVTIYDGTNHMAYAQYQDPETERWYGMNFYEGFTHYTPLEKGNLVRLVGNISLYTPDPDNPENASYQVSGLNYLAMTPDYEGSMKLLQKNVEVTPLKITSDDLSNEKEDPEDTLTKGEKLESVLVSMDDLTVVSAYTTTNSSIKSDGALTLTCKDANNKEVIVRTSVLKKSDNTILTKEEVEGKTISVNGIVAKYGGKLQIRVFTINDLTIKNA